MQVSLYVDEGTTFTTKIDEAGEIVLIHEGCCTKLEITFDGQISWTKFVNVIKTMIGELEIKKVK